MGATVVVGGQWGDEGKAKIVDFLMSEHDVVIRYQGGANAGHTVVSHDGKFAFHLIPSGVLFPHITGVLGSGMVIDPFGFIDEFQQLVTRGIDLEGRVMISSSAHVVMPYHKIVDNLLEAELKDKKIGSTGKGIGPAYTDKYSRKGMRFSSFMLDKEDLFEEVKTRVDFANRFLEVFNAPKSSAEKIAADFANIKEIISHFVVDLHEKVTEFKKDGKRILLEGAQGTLLDIDHGTYPYVTSSSCTIGGALSGSGLNHRDISKVVGIFKSYVTRVGNGPFPTELPGEEGQILRDRGAEYGTTTGRPRRCGWFDVVAARYAVELNGITDIALTKLDVLSGYKTVKIATSYQLDGKRIDKFPQDVESLRRCVPVYEEIEGWQGDLDASSFDGLPDGAKKYVERLERELGTKITYISTGPERKRMIVR